ncbi:MAG TPA: orotidine-5'-phosphate decarboxylase [Spirochaetaceae bacterium]|nr:orotidine-5'-phosphate decarboxylase [Spirochaetaceae bacterium]
MGTYLDLLKKSAEKTGNIACMGLDPIGECLFRWPETQTNMGAVERHFKALLNRMRTEGLRPAAFKPNVGYYVALEFPTSQCNFSLFGEAMLKETLSLFDYDFDDIPVILDSKRGDIAKSSANYAAEAFDKYSADAVTVSPYMGTDSVMPFAVKGKGAYVLCRTSNPGAAVIQNLRLENGEELYMHIARQIIEWNRDFEGFGAVVGATNLREFENIAELFAPHRIPMLIPGVGSQGGSAKDVMKILKKVGYPLYLARINSSSALTHPWKKGPAPSDWLEQCTTNISNLIEETAI